MKYIVAILCVLTFAGCSSSDRCDIPEDIKLYGMQVMYFYEDPTADRIALALEYRGPALKRMYRECDASAYKHAVEIDSVFFGLVGEKHGFKVISSDKLDGVQWTADLVKNHSVKYGGDLDHMWAAFFATGDLVWIDLVASYINNGDKSISGPAKWSCGANYRQHRVIKAYVDSKPQLKELIFTAKNPG